MKVKSVISVVLTVLSIVFAACNTATVDDPNKDPQVKSGEFSISATQKVKFAPGNLQYQASTNTLRFARQQYDTIGALNANISASYDGWIDLFGWGTGDEPAKCIAYSDTKDYNSYYTKFTDWGTKKIESYEPNTWRTLTQAEWAYILYTRANADKLFAGAKVNGVVGFILLPDNWTTPSGIVFTASSEKGLTLKQNSAGMSIYSNDNLDNYKHNTYTAEEWKVLENNGAIFLPITGFRFGKQDRADNGGYYWTATLDEANSWSNSKVAYWLNFSNKEFAVVYYCDTAMGNAVRLVQDL